MRNDGIGKVAVCATGILGVITEIDYAAPSPIYRGTALFESNKSWESMNPRFVSAEDAARLRLAAKWLADQEAD